MMMMRDRIMRTRLAAARRMAVIVVFLNYLLLVLTGSCSSSSGLLLYPSRPSSSWTATLLTTTTMLIAVARRTSGWTIPHYLRSAPPSSSSTTTSLGRCRRERFFTVSTSTAEEHYSLSTRSLTTTTITNKEKMTTAALAKNKSVETVSSSSTTTTTTAASSSSSGWTLRHGLLFSSFTEGLVRNPPARTALLRGVIRAWLRQQQRRAEQWLESSVRASPCNGPNTEAWRRVEDLDRALERLNNNNNNNNDNDPLEILRNVTSILSSTTNNNNKNVEFRFVYIPTAMYALRPESTNTPGKQRQRARADAKQRRNEIVRLLQQELSSSLNNNNNNSSSNDDVVCSIRTVTLDLYDGSVKHPEEWTTTATASSTGTTSTPRVAAATTDFPTTGQHALDDWQPHLVYVQGGNTFWLYHCLLETGHNNKNNNNNWPELLTRLLQSSDDGAGDTFYCGASAGAIVVGASMETACWKGWDDPLVLIPVGGRTTYADWHNVTGLGWCGNYSFFPHYNREDWSDVVQTKGRELRERTGSEIICLRDDQVCLVEGASQRITIL